MKKSASQPFRAVRVFVSSTFRDMHAERDYLAKIVFPELRHVLEGYHVLLDDVDLRWGVSREQAESDRVVEVCLDAIDECRPFFLGLLGERYGSVPATFAPEAVRKHAWLATARGESITELEILHGVLRDPAAGRRAAFFYRDSAFVDRLPPSKRPDFLADSPEAERRLNGLKRSIEGRAKVLSYRPAYRGLRLDWRAAKQSLDPEAYCELRRRLPTGMLGAMEYDRLPRELQPLVDRCSVVALELGAFGRLVRDELFAIIRQELDLPASPQGLPEIWGTGVSLPRAGSDESLALEDDSQRWWMEKKRRVFVGRGDELAKLRDYVYGDAQAPLVLEGPAGSGKSALLVELIAQCRRDDPKLAVFEHFVGAASLTFDVQAVLMSICTRLERACGFDGPEPEGVSGALGIFSWALGHVRTDRRVLVVVDGLELLEDSEGMIGLRWLPKRLPGNVRLICSRTIPDDEAEPPRQLLPLAPVRLVRLEPLADEERKGIVRRVPLLAAKTLEEEQVEALARAPGSGNPLYLTVALEELRGLASPQHVSAYIRQLPRGEAAAVVAFDGTLARLEDELGGALAGTALALLAVARYGLYEAEWMRACQWCLGRARQIDATGYLIVEPDLVDALFATLSQLRPYVFRRGMFLRFAHPSLAQAILDRWHSTAESARRGLIEFFWSQQLSSHAGSTDRYRVVFRKLKEVPWQLARLGDWRSLARLLTDPAFFKSWARDLSDSMREPVWQRCRNDVLHYWREIERNSRIRRREAYAPVVEKPDEYVPAYLEVVERILHGGACSEEAQALRESLARRYSSGQYSPDHRRALMDAFYAPPGAEGAARMAELKRLRQEARELEESAVREYDRGNGDRAAALFRQAELAYRQLGATGFSLDEESDRARECVGGQAEALYRSRRFEEAATRAELHELLVRETGDMVALAFNLGIQAVIRLELGDAEAAERLAQEAAHWVERCGDPKAGIRLEAIRGKLACSRGDVDRVRKTVERLGRLAEQHGDSETVDFAHAAARAIRPRVPWLPLVMLPMMLVGGILLCRAGGWWWAPGVLLCAWCLCGLVAVASRILGFSVAACPKCGRPALSRGRMRHCAKCGSGEAAAE